MGVNELHERIHILGVGKKIEKNPASRLCLRENNELSQPVSRVLSWTIINLGCFSQNTSSSLPEPSTGRAIRFLFGLTPSGVYRAKLVAKLAVRSYRTFSPLPPESGGLFSVALSVDLHRPGVTWRFTLWSPDFPPFFAKERLSS